LSNGFKKNNVNEIFNNDDIFVKKSLSEIDKMEGLQFEHYISILLKYEDFLNVYNTKGSGDYGADIIAEKDGCKYAIQCKRYSNKIGAKPVGEVLRGMKKYHCDKGIIITNNYFTKQAIEEADICGIVLWNRDKLKSIIKKHNLAETSTSEPIQLPMHNINFVKKKMEIQKIDFNDCKNTAQKIQQAYCELGFNVKVVDIDTLEYETKYKCIHEIDDYLKIFSPETGKNFLKILNIENVKIKEIDEKYFVISIPLQIIFVC
jgi:hypothetical protein